MSNDNSYDFRNQIEEDIRDIQDRLQSNHNINKPEYAFNHWVLENIYNVDLEIANNSITEYNDKGIDCFVHYENDKELYIIQNKYYSNDTKVKTEHISEFLTRPINALNKGDYKNKDLQQIYDNAIKDEDYKIHLHFYVSNDKESEEGTDLINNYKQEGISAEIFYLSDIKEKYYEGGDEGAKNFSYSIEYGNKDDIISQKLLKIYNQMGHQITEFFYVKTKVSEMFKMFVKSKKEKYPLFEANIREYLGNSGINKKIIETLNSDTERNNFFFYNNGITIISDEADHRQALTKLKLTNPQIVNGCQTINSINEVLKSKKDEEINKDFEKVFVMLKILIVDKTEDKDKKFYTNVVKYNNSQNSINEKSFASTLAPFEKIQENLQKKGILLEVKQSDKNSFKEKNEIEKSEIIKKLKHYNDFFDVSKKLIQIKLETLLQIVSCMVHDSYYAYTKKSYLLKPASNEYYVNFSKNIKDYFTTDGLINLIILYKQAEKNRKDSEDKRNPIPFYLIYFIAYYLKKEDVNISNFMTEIKPKELYSLYDIFENMPDKYRRAYISNSEDEGKSKSYNDMIKSKMNTKWVDEKIYDRISDIKKEENYNNIKSVIDRIKK